MNLRRFATIVLGLSLTAGFSTAAVAAPSIRVTLTTQDANTATIRVEGRGFSRNRAHQVEVNQGGAFSGNLPETFTVSANPSGAFTVTQRVASSCACRIGCGAPTGRRDSTATPSASTCPRRARSRRSRSRATTTRRTPPSPRV